MPRYLRERSSYFWCLTGALVIAAVGAADIWTGSELSFSLFYLIPIVIVTWYSGRRPGMVVSAASAAMWFLADLVTGHAYSQPAIRYWNAVMRLGFFIVVALLVPALKALELEKFLARTDPLTGIANRRHCFEALQTEIDRSLRYEHPFTVAFLDIDGFKTVNDQRGHRIGDKLLCAVARKTSSRLRKTDLVARFGGDEFVILFREPDQDAARIAVSKIQNALLEEMRRNNWPVTFSTGILTCLKGQITADEVIKRADQLMYSVKKNGKNAVVFGTYPD